MKKLIMTLIAAAVVIAVFAYPKNPISFNELPKNAQAFIHNHFDADDIAYVNFDSDIMDRDYKVVFNNGHKVEFDRNGEWKEVDCKNASVPGGIVPDLIEQFVETNYNNARIMGIEKDDRDYEVKLSNGLELTFDRNFKLKDIDD